MFLSDGAQAPHSLPAGLSGKELTELKEARCPAAGLLMARRCALHTQTKPTTASRTLAGSTLRGSNENEVESSKMASSELKANTLYQFIMGIDEAPKVMSEDSKRKNLQDLFPKLLDKTFPLTLIELIDQARRIFPATLGVDAEKALVNSSKPTNIRVYRVAEAGMVPSSVQPQPDRTYRIAVAIFAQAKGDPDIFVSTGSFIDDKKQFLQLISWDEQNKWFNFYARLDGSWAWVGNSKHALEPKTRGQSPFCGHVNGSPIMKELRIPWNGWRSSMAQFDDSILPPDSPLITKYPFLTDRSEEDIADGLEKLVRAGISRWNNGRIDKSVTGNTLNDVPYIMRQLLSTTTINLNSSQNTSDNRHSDPIHLPITLFLNTDVFSFLGFEGPFDSVSVDRKRYQAMVEKYGCALNDGAGFKQVGDTFFAFLVPEPTAEDFSLLKILINKKMITPRFAACIYMVDFCNPVYSKQREALLQYAPASVISDKEDFATTLEKAFVSTITSSTKSFEKGTPEFVFLENWAIVQEEGWEDKFNKTVMDYWKKATTRANTDEGFDQLFQLAESRRWQFKKTPLFEFPLTFAITNMPESMFPLVMQQDGTVKPLAQQALTGARRLEEKEDKKITVATSNANPAVKKKRRRKKKVKSQTVQ